MERALHNFKVAVTGATGLIGVHTVARLLAQGYAVRALVRDPGKLSAVTRPFGIAPAAIEAVTGDIINPADIEKLLDGCDAAIHAAGLFSDDQRDAERMRRINVDGTACVLETASKCFSGPVVYVSSYLALFPPRGPVIRTSDPAGTPKNVYARTKADAERVARRHQENGAPVVIVYPGAVHGPHDPTFSIGPQMIARYVRAGVLVTEGGLVYTDVRDLAAVCVGALQGAAPNRYMFGGFFLKHEELLKLLRKLTGRDIPAQRISGGLLRAIGRLGDWLAPLRGKPPQLTLEAATVLTRTVPCDDRPTLEALKLQTISAEDSFRDLLLWMYRAGHLSRADIGALADMADAAAANP